MDSKLRVYQLENRFKEHTQFTYADLYEFYKEDEPDLKENTFKWRVWKLKETGILSNIKKGIYVLGKKQNYSPLISNRIKRIKNKIEKQFPYANYAILDTKWLNDFMVHQPGNFMTIVEIESDVISSVLSLLQEKEKNVYSYVNFKNDINYILSKDDAILIKPLISRAPVVEYEGAKIPKLEKILVDLFIDTELFITYQGKELINIFNSANENYALNYTTIFGYADRRNKKIEIDKFIFEKTNIDLQQITEASND